MKISFEEIEEIDDFVVPSKKYKFNCEDDQSLNIEKVDEHRTTIIEKRDVNLDTELNLEIEVDIDVDDFKKKLKFDNNLSEQEAIFDDWSKDLNYFTPYDNENQEIGGDFNLVYL